MPNAALLVARPHSNVADDERERYFELTGLTPAELDVVNLHDVTSFRDLSLAQYSALVITGSPYNFSTPASEKSPGQHHIELLLESIYREILDGDIPSLSVCFGFQYLGALLGGVVDPTYAEAISAPHITLTEAGVVDPLLEGMPRTFQAYVGHNDGLTTCPPEAVCLASSTAVPTQMMRVRSNIYGTQFHPELTLPAIEMRIALYGGTYFPEEERASILAECRAADVAPANSLLRRFFDRYLEKSAS